MASSAANPTTIESRYARLCAEVAGAAAAGANSAESGVPTLAGGEGAARTPSPPEGAAALAPNLPPSASAGMDMINEMFQKQARRLEAQLLQQAQDRKMLDLAQTQLMILQQEVARHQSSNAQLQQRVTMSDDSVRLVRSQVDAMRENQQQARHTPRNSGAILAHSSDRRLLPLQVVDLCRRIHSNVQQLRATLQEEAPGKLEELGTSLSELADGERPLPGCGRGQESPKDGSDPHSESTDTEGSVASSAATARDATRPRLPLPPVQGVYPGQGVLCYQGVIGPEADAALAAVAAVLPASSDEASKEFVKEYQKRKRAGSNSASGSGSGSDEASHISGPLRVVATVDSRA